MCSMSSSAERRQHDGQSAGQHRHAVLAQAGDAVRVGALVLEEQALQALQALAA